MMDAERFKRELLPYHRKLFAVAYKLMENSNDAADLVQDAYLKLWEKRDALEHIDNFEAFAIATVRHLCLDQLRSTRYNQARDWVELERAPDPSDEEQTELSDKARQVRHLIRQLPEAQQQVVRMRDIQGCTIDEIAQTTGLQASNIRVMLSRARKRIREAFLHYT